MPLTRIFLFSCDGEGCCVTTAVAEEISLYDDAMPRLPEGWEEIDGLRDYQYLCPRCVARQQG